MLQVVRVIISFVAALMFVGCDVVDLKGLIAPTGEVVNVRFEKSMTLNNGKAKSVVDADKTYLFYVCADPHLNTSYNNLREFSTQLRNDSQARFGVILGDCTDPRNLLSYYMEAIEFVPQDQAANTPIFSVLGNHDLYFDGWKEFYQMLGASVYWFDVKYESGCDLFICIDSASGTLGKKQMKWLREFLATERDKYRHCVVLTHTNLFYTDNSQTGSGNMALEETAALTELFSRHKVTLCLQGHDHYREDLTLDGVRYTIVGTIRDESDKAEYLKVSVSDEGVEYSWENIGRR